MEFTIQLAVEYLPRGTVFNFGGTEFTADIDSEEFTVGQYEWDIPPNFGWIDDQKVTVSANLAPAPESATVDGTTLVLTHSEDLNTGSTPAALEDVSGLNAPDSEDFMVTNNTAATVPGAPTGLTATASGDTINLSWDAPSNDGGAAITGYRIDVSSNGGTSWTDLVANTNSTSTSYPHTGLSPGTTRPSSLTPNPSTSGARYIAGQSQPPRRVRRRCTTV